LPDGSPFDLVGICEGDTFAPLSLTRVVTENSVWLLQPDVFGSGGKYMRMPRDEGPRWATYSPWDRLTDGAWLDYEYARWTCSGLNPGEFRLNIKPVAGPPNGYGIATGVVCEVSSRQPV
jgi:hypothetical protein